ncbi:MAG: hypothetical protein ACHQ0J_10665 [Candidatus Dormibacterales bacterium]
MTSSRRSYWRLSHHPVAAIFILLVVVLIVARLVSFVDWLQGPPIVQLATAR